MRACVFGILAAVVATASIVGCDSNPASSTQHKHSDSEVLNFAVGDSATIVADTFVGSITFGPRALDGVQITVIKWAGVEGHLDLLRVDSSESQGVVQVEASNPHDLDQVAVDMEILGPPEAILDFASGVGRVECAGRPGVRWEADVGVGDVVLELPGDVNVSVELQVGVGRVSVDFDVDGEVTARRVVGTIGTGDEGEIVAHVGVGDIALVGP